MSISSRQREIVQEFSKLTDWQDRYQKIIVLGKDLPPLEPQYKTENYRVKGCQSQVWLHAQLNSQNQVVYSADSDAMIVKGLAALLIQIYSQSSPDEVLSSPADFLKEIGLENHLSPSRANGLYSMLKQFMYYAAAFKALLNQKSV